MVDSEFKNYKKHLKCLKKKGIIKNKNDEIEFWKELAKTFYYQINRNENADV